MTHRHRLIAAMLSIALVVSCGDSPATPAPVVIDIGGAWTGTWTFVTAGVTVTDAVTVTFTQSGTSAGGQWSSASGSGGQLTVSVGPTISGSASISQTLISGVNCTTSTTIAGTATSSRVQFTLGALTSAGLCQWATNQQFTLTR